MTKGNRLFLTLGAAGIVVIGLFLPRLCSGLQDRHTAEKISTYAIGDVTLRLSAKMEDSLGLIAGGYTLTELSGGDTLDAGTAHQAAVEAARYFAERGFENLTLDPTVQHSETPFLAISMDNSVTAVLWKCHLYNDGGESAALYVDDHSGRLLAFESTRPGKVGSGGESSFSAPTQTAENIAAIAAAYYGLMVESVRERTLGQANREICYDVSLQGSAGDLLTFSLSFLGDTIVFNQANIPTSYALQGTAATLPLVDAP